jgi:flagellar FliL protein
MAAKPEAASAAAKDAVAVAAPAAAGAPAGPAPARGPLAAWLPVIAAIVLSPVATWATVQFVLLPQMQKKLVAPAAADVAKGAEGGEAEGGKGHSGKGTGAPGYEFSSVVVNLSGTMGTRYLKTTFLVTGPDPDIKGIFEGAKPRLTDITLNVLSSLTLADLEEPGSKNVIRERLVTAYNQALGRKVAEQVYFSDFVIQ